VAAAEKALNRTGDMPIDMAYFSAEDAPPAHVCQRRVREADVLVVLAGFRYGSLVPGTTVSYTELEYETAKHATIPRIVLLIDEEAALPAWMIRDPAGGTRQEEFRRRLQGEILAESIANPDQLEAALLAAMATVKSGLARRWSAADRGRRSSGRLNGARRRSTVVAGAVGAVLAVVGSVVALSIVLRPGADVTALSSASTPSVVAAGARTVDLPAARQFIQAYYTILTEEPERAWNLQLPGFQQKSESYDGFRDFALGYRKITVGGIEADSQRPGWFLAQLTYIRSDNGGKDPESISFKLACVDQPGSAGSAPSGRCDQIRIEDTVRA